MTPRPVPRPRPLLRTRDPLGRELRPCEQIRPHEAALTRRVGLTRLGRRRDPQLPSVGLACVRPRGRVVLRKIDSPDGVLAIEGVGKLEAGDYGDVIVPALRSMIEARDAIRCVFVFGDEYTGLTLGGDV